VTSEPVSEKRIQLQAGRWGGCCWIGAAGGGGAAWELAALVRGEASRWAVDATTIDYLSVDVGAQLGLRVLGNTWINVFAG